MILEGQAPIGFAAGKEDAAVTSTLTLSGYPRPAEWEIELILEGKQTFLRNDNQLQWESSVRCGYYCLLFLNERNKGRTFREILSMFSENTRANEAVVKDYFSHKV